MRKLVSILLCITLVLCMSTTAFACTSNNIIKGEYKYMPSLSFIAKSDPSDRFLYSDEFFIRSGYEYNHDLAKMTIDLVNAGSPSYGTTWDKSNKNFIDLMKKCGFTNVATNIEEAPTADSIGINIASKKIGDYTLLAVALRGNGYDKEWSSNFKVGNEGDHQGFSEASDQVLDYIKAYIEEYNVNGNIKIWIGGYSRSGITANMTAGALDQNQYLGSNVSFSPEDLYCYTFEAPLGTANEDCRSELYYNIHNILNVNDAIPLISLWHDRYGIDYYLPSRQADGAYYYTLKLAVEKILSRTDMANILGFPMDTIDDFRYISLDPVTAIKKSDITQIEFFDELGTMIEANSLDRDYYVANLQDELMKVGKQVPGLIEDMEDILIDFYQTFAQYDNLKKLHDLLEEGTEEARDMAFDMVKELLEAVLAKYEYDDIDLDVVMEKICAAIPVMLDAFEKYPDMMLTFMANSSSILNAHFIEVNRAWLDVTPEKFFIAQRPDYLPDVQ